MSWFFLITAGIFECAWSTTMKMSEGVSKIGYAIATVIDMWI